MSKLIKIAECVAVATVGLAALDLAAPAPAHSDLDPSDCYVELRKDGILLSGNENYLLGFRNQLGRNLTGRGTTCDIF
jgi:hypothetical protein